MLISASIVTFNNSHDDLLKVFESFLNSSIDGILFVVDNSINRSIESLIKNERLIYIFNNDNLGFGKGHNIAIQNAINIGSKYHFIINPDVFFGVDVINNMVVAIENDSNIGMMMPQILNLDGSIQHLPKLLPSPLNIFWRKIQLPFKFYSRFISKYEFRFVAKGVTYNAPVLSGCFTLLNLSAIKEVGLYDDKFFMYFEDWDLSRRMHKKYKTIYFPEVSVYHGYESGANKNFRLFIIFIKSAIIYFNKWGWFFDIDRGRINKAALAQFNL
jgi:GT2 family glycosyltransferase